MDKLQSRAGKYVALAPNLASQTPMIILGMNDQLMNILCSYVLSNNKNIHRYSLNNLHKLMNSIGKNSFAQNPILDQKYKFLLVALESKVVKGLNGDLLLYDINIQMDATSLLNDPDIVKELTNDDIIYIEGAIANFLDNMALDNHIQSLKDLCDDYSNSDFRQRNEVLVDLKSEMAGLMTEFRRNEASKSSSTTRFRLSKMNDSIGEIHEYLRHPSNMLITGMKVFNDILGGGFQKTRVYCLFSLAGEGKTVSMVNLLYQTWKYNKGFKTKDPTKKPCIVLLTMENLVVEYVNSLFHVVTRGKSIKEYESAEAVLKEFQDRKFEYLDESDIEIVIDYKPVHTKDTRYLYELAEELEEEGFEVIAFFMDYLMRIRPAEYTKDSYTDLGNVSNDFKTFAILKDIPFITASQLNREAAKVIEEGRGTNQLDLVKKLNRANIGDSLNIDRNIDGSIFLIPERKSEEERYMGFKLGKARYEVKTAVRSFYQPIYPESKIAFVEDVYELTPASRETLNITEEEIKMKMGETIQVSSTPNIKSLKDFAKTTTKQVLASPPVIPKKEKFLRKVVFEIPDKIRKTKDSNMEIPDKERKAVERYIFRQNLIEVDKEKCHRSE